MKTYSETQGQEPIDWPAFINRAKERKVDDEKFEMYISYSMSWVTCACGNLCDMTPRYQEDAGEPGGMPLDRHLASLGSKFYITIFNAYWDYRAGFDRGRLDDALNILTDIEQRAAEILNNINYDPSLGE